MGATAYVSARSPETLGTQTDIRPSVEERSVCTFRQTNPLRVSGI